jgi:hypothetical protein
MLAFKNDVSHWRKKNELVGVSVRTVWTPIVIVRPVLVVMTFSQIITNVVVQAIIMLYLLDNNTETSWMIIFGQGMGIVIEAWKITKAVDINLVRAPAGSVLPYTIVIKGEQGKSVFAARR